jgi:small subunit ribosomal protein S6
MNSYELAILYDPDLEIDLDKAADKIKQLISANGGKITGEDNWGKRKLAYKIKGHDMALYVFYAVDLPPESVKPIEATLNITDEVIRFLITKPDFKAIKKAEAAKAAKAKSAKKREEHEAAERKEAEGSE